MDENRQQDEQAAQGKEPDDLEALIALVEARVVEHLTRAIERMVQERERAAPGTGK